MQIVSLDINAIEYDCLEWIFELWMSTQAKQNGEIKQMHSQEIYCKFHKCNFLYFGSNFNGVVISNNLSHQKQNPYKLIFIGIWNRTSWLYFYLKMSVLLYLTLIWQNMFRNIWYIYLFIQAYIIYCLLPQFNTR